MQSDHYTKLVTERYRPLLEPVETPVPLDIAARANQITYLHCRPEIVDGKSRTLWQKDVFEAAKRAMSEHGRIRTYDYDGTNQAEVNQAFNFEGLHLVQMASILIAEQEKETGRETPPELLSSKLASVIEHTYREMKRMHDFNKRGGDTGFKR